MLFALVEVTMQSPTEPEHSQLTPTPTDAGLLAPGPQARPRFGGTLLSFALHGGVLALVLFGGTWPDGHAG